MHHQITPTADELAGIAWYNSQTEDTLRFWHAIAGSAAPVDAWIAYRDTAGNDCLPPATQAAPAQSLAAAAGTGQGAGTYEIACPPGMLAHGHHIKRFTSLQAFEGYVAHLHSAGRTVTWHAPFAARVEARA